VSDFLDCRPESALPTPVVTALTSLLPEPSRPGCRLGPQDKNQAGIAAAQSSFLQVSHPDFFYDFAEFGVLFPNEIAELGGCITDRHGAVSFEKLLDLRLHQYADNCTLQFIDDRLRRMGGR
jgi:hypothetical protein